MLVLRVLVHCVLMPGVLAGVDVAARAAGDFGSRLFRRPDVAVGVLLRHSSSSSLPEIYPLGVLCKCVPAAGAQEADMDEHSGRAHHGYISDKDAYVARLKR